MKKGRFTETQIVKALQEEGVGRKADDITRWSGYATALVGIYNHRCSKPLKAFTGMDYNDPFSE